MAVRKLIQEVKKLWIYFKCCWLLSYNKIYYIKIRRISYFFNMRLKPINIYIRCL